MTDSIRSIMAKLILPEHTVRIKLLGDSITHGVGGTGFKQDGEPIAANFSRNPNGYCWANLFRDHMQQHYDCCVINNACTGTNIDFILQHFSELVNDEDDIILCAIGTNNRHQYFSSGEKREKKDHMECFYQNILTLHEKLKSSGKDVIFIANIPASDANEQDGTNYWRIFHMNDVHDLYMKASVTASFPMISFYSAITEYCVQKGISINVLLADGLHPNDEGHRVMFQLILRELGIAPVCP